MLIGGYDKKEEKPVLNWIDYLAANVTLPYAAHGYASYYVLSLLDRHHKPGLTLEEGMELMGLCVEEIKRRIPIDFKGIQVSKYLRYLYHYYYSNSLKDSSRGQRWYPRASYSLMSLYKSINIVKFYHVIHINRKFFVIFYAS